MAERAQLQYPADPESQGAILQAISHLASSGAPGPANRFITEKALQIGAPIYKADSAANDTYVITLSPIPESYVTGMVFHFKATTANTGAATLNVNSLGAKTIKKRNDVDLETGDIEAGQIVTVVYDGTNFQMQSQVASGFSNLSKSYTAGEAIDASTTPQVVYVKNSDGKIYKTDSDADESAFSYVGFVGGAQNLSINDAAIVTYSGILGGFSGLTIGAEQYISGTAGSTTESIPANNRGRVIGIAISATEILIFNESLRVASGSTAVGSGAATTTNAITIGFRVRFFLSFSKGSGSSEVSAFTGMWHDTLDQVCVGLSDKFSQNPEVTTAKLCNDLGWTDEALEITIGSITTTGFSITFTRSDGIPVSTGSLYYVAIG